MSDYMPAQAVAAVMRSVETVIVEAPLDLVYEPDQP